MDFVFFKLKVLDAEGKETNHPLFDGHNRLSDDGTMFLVHRELVPKEYPIPKTSTMLSSLALASKVDASPICVKDEIQTKNLMATVAWSAKEVTVNPDIKEEVVAKL